MTYGIYVTKEIFDIFEDGSKKKVYHLKDGTRMPAMIA